MRRPSADMIMRPSAYCSCATRILTSDLLNGRVGLVKNTKQKAQLSLRKAEHPKPSVRVPITEKSDFSELTRFHARYVNGKLLLKVTRGRLARRYKQLDTATYSLKASIENCRQTAADGNMVTIGSL